MRRSRRTASSTWTSSRASRRSWTAEAPRTRPTRADGSGDSATASEGGTGRAAFGPAIPPGPGPPPFPTCCDSDADGFGEIGSSSSCRVGEDCVVGFQLLHGARSAEIGTGQVLIECASSCRAQQPEFDGTLQFVFATVPALVSYRDTAGDSATVSYPVGPGGLGTPGNPFPVAPGPSGDMEATLTFWRPQRSRAAGDPSPKPGESTVWTDIGRLDYRVTLSGPDRGNCPKSAYRESDRNLASPATDPDGGGILPDAALDQPASRANTLTYTVNLSE